MSRLMIRGLVIGLTALAAGLANAQSQAGYTHPQASKQSGPPNFVAGGFGVGPKYTGSENYRIIPYVAFMANTKYARFQSRGLAIEADILAPKQGRNAITYGFGPSVGFNFGRNFDDADSPEILALGEIDPSLDLGVFGSIAKRGVLTKRDRLSLRLQSTANINGVYDGLTSRVSASYAPQLSRKWGVSFSLGASYGSDSFHDVYASVSPEGSAVSGLPVYDANAGFYRVSASTNIMRNFKNNWLIGGQFSVGNALGDFADSPIVESKTMFIGGLYIGRTFR